MAQQNIYHDPRQSGASRRSDITEYSNASNPDPSNSFPNTDYAAMSSYVNSPQPLQEKERDCPILLHPPKDWMYLSGKLTYKIL
jgi:hypothetical protein